MPHDHTSARIAPSTTQVDNAFTRITRYDFAPGASTGWHRHEFAYAIVPLTDGTLRITGAAGEVLVPLKAGVCYAREAGVEHDVFNHGTQPLSFVEVEMKKA